MGCRKLIAIDPPLDTVTTVEVFSTDALATSAMAGVYTLMANGNGNFPQPTSGFSMGLTTILGGLSSDELFLSSGNSGNQMYLYNTNRISALNSGASTTLWTSAYKIIYGSNSVIEGIAASTAPALHNNVRTELTAQAKFVRAFCYFYLTNFFGDVPMVLTVDFNKTRNLRRMPQQEVYQQIIKDLIDAQAALPPDYSAGQGERVIPNKWAATLLLARAYLYIGDYINAAAQATAVISHTALFGLETDLNRVFLIDSREAVWQLKQTNESSAVKNATTEGYGFNLPSPYSLTNQLLSGFDAEDQRKLAWVGSSVISGSTRNYPHKYKIGSKNGEAYQPPLEYYMILRLAEAYLIRAEATANGALGGIATAISDLNIIRNRADLDDLNEDLSQQQVIAAVAKEKQIEFFSEWGHRWFDLKRTGKAGAVLSAIPLKQPWPGNYQLLYPIPVAEIIIDPFLTQNPDY
ncbi:MAG: RagB/SusD family nutrient uptake outer membrane protein [Pedobacter sp.]|uniref:RagB/SusD family nutrient uptake outer membrane protein n=1 Tax=Pedobacter sp. TaxID=1411316 RepID=UPI00356AB100